eukprot:scaffold2119_cov355-Prasinococcus_capsulatus_cf.AAC.16
MLDVHVWVAFLCQQRATSASVAGLTTAAELGAYRGGAIDLNVDYGAGVALVHVQAMTHPLARLQRHR